MTDEEIEVIQRHHDRCFELWEYERKLLEEVKKLRKWIEGIRFSTITALEFVDKDQYYEFLKGVPEEAAELLGLKEPSGITAKRMPPPYTPMNLADRPETFNIDLDNRHLSLDEE